MIWKNALGGQNEEEFITKITFNLVNHLTKQSQNENFEIRECSFKALDQVLATTKSQEIDVKSVYFIIKEAIKFEDFNPIHTFSLKQQKGKMFDECTKCAAISCLASFIHHQKQNDQHLEEYLPIISTLLKDEKDDETILLSCLKLLKSLVENHFSYSLKKYNLFISDLYLFIKSDAFGLEIKNLSIYIYSLIITDVKVNSNWTQQIINGFLPKDEEDEDEEFVGEVFVETSIEKNTKIENLKFLNVFFKKPNELNYLKSLSQFISNKSFLELLSKEVDELSKLLVYLNFSLYGEEEFQADEDEEYKSSAFKIPSFSFEQLKKLKYIVSISIELYKLKKDENYLNALAKNLA
jgi:hypothetical protein